MKQPSTIRLTFVIILLLILATYSSEMDFMPNYKDRPDKWHLFVPMLIFYPALIIGTILVLIKQNWRQQRTELLGISILSLVGFVFLNNPKGSSQVIGYLVTFGLFAIATFRLIQTRLERH